MWDVHGGRRGRTGPFVAALLVVASAPFAAARQSAATEDLAERSVPLVFDAACERLRAANDLPGLAVLAVWKGEVVAQGVAGVRRFGEESPLSLDDAFHLGSCGKAMTSTVIARCIEAGDLDWSTTLADGLPELAEHMDPGYRDVTVEQLLRHRGGIAERTDPEVGKLIERFFSLEGTPRQQRLEVAEMVLSRKPTRVPGASTEYSNYGYMIAAALTENLTDRPWHELIQEELFTPMGLSSAGYGSPCGDDVAVGHRRVDGHLEALPPGPRGALPDCMGPAGLEHMTLLDWTRFVRSHLRGVEGEDGLLRAATYQRLHELRDGARYACGWGVRDLPWAKGECWTHDGSDGTWYSLVQAAPKLDLVLVVASNCGDADSASSTLAREVIAGLDLR